MVILSCETEKTPDTSSVTQAKIQEDVIEVQLLSTASLPFYDPTSMPAYNGTIIPAYDGVGIVNSKGIVNYFISLDADDNKEYSYKIYKIRNEGFFIHLTTQNEVVLSNLNHNICQIDFELKKQEPTPKEYKVVLYHDNRVIDKNEAKQRFDNANLQTKSKTSRTAVPDKTGTGTIMP